MEKYIHVHVYYTETCIVIQLYDSQWGKTSQQSWTVLFRVCLVVNMSNLSDNVHVHVATCLAMNLLHVHVHVHILCNVHVHVHVHVHMHVYMYMYMYIVYSPGVVELQS